jgi:hypothetical protein
MSLTPFFQATIKVLRRFTDFASERVALAEFAVN